MLCKKLLSLYIVHWIRRWITYHILKRVTIKITAWYCWCQRPHLPSERKEKKRKVITVDCSLRMSHLQARDIGRNWAEDNNSKIPGTHNLYKLPAETQMRTCWEQQQKTLALTSYRNCQQRVRWDHPGSNSKTPWHLHAIEIASRDSDENILGATAKDPGTYKL